MAAGHFQPPPFQPNRPELVAPVQVDPAGRSGPTRGQARGPRWRGTSSHLYVPSDVELTVEQRIVEAASLIPARGGAVTGWAALRWMGGRWFDGSTSSDPSGLPVDLALPVTVRPRPGVSLCRERWNPAEMIVVDGLPVTIPLRSVAFAMRYASGVEEAVRVLDLAAFNDLVSVAEVIDYAGLAPRLGLSSYTGIQQCRDAIALADENTWSPQEVTMKLIWTRDAGFPAPLMNQPVFDLRGHLVGTPDLLDVEAGLAGEYEGSLHLLGSQRARDVRREEKFRTLGLEFVTMLAGDAADRAGMVARMRAARGRARWLPEDHRAWTIVPPPWWTPTVTVDQRRSLSPSQRARLLRHRHVA